MVRSRRTRPSIADLPAAEGQGRVDLHGPAKTGQAGDQADDNGHDRQLQESGDLQLDGEREAGLDGAGDEDAEQGSGDAEDEGLEGQTAVERSAGGARGLEHGEVAQALEG